eukprot:m.62148 g.62148  ORF g.62148 m.62148 type:complete len:628 (+) comp9600_c0_seq1:173-2056(+)
MLGSQWTPAALCMAAVITITAGHTCNGVSDAQPHCTQFTAPCTVPAQQLCPATCGVCTTSSTTHTHTTQTTTTLSPTTSPTSQPTRLPSSSAPSTAAPVSPAPTNVPTGQPTMHPTNPPPTAAPTVVPSFQPTTAPSAAPTQTPSSTAPTAMPTLAPSVKPTQAPSVTPTAIPTSDPTTRPTASPTRSPTSAPTANPTKSPTAIPSVAPSAAPSLSPSRSPTVEPTALPTASPSRSPSAVPSAMPTTQPSAVPTGHPSTSPTSVPTHTPTQEPTATPTVPPTLAPTTSTTTSRTTTSRTVTTTTSTTTAAVRFEVFFHFTEPYFGGANVTTVSSTLAERIRPGAALALADLIAVTTTSREIETLATMSARIILGTAAATIEVRALLRSRSRVATLYGNRVLTDLQATVVVHFPGVTRQTADFTTLASSLLTLARGSTPDATAADQAPESIEFDFTEIDGSAGLTATCSFARPDAATAFLLVVLSANGVALNVSGSFIRGQAVTTTPAPTVPPTSTATEATPTENVGGLTPVQFGVVVVAAAVVVLVLLTVAAAVNTPGKTEPKRPILPPNNIYQQSGGGVSALRPAAVGEAPFEHPDLTSNQNHFYPAAQFRRGMVSPAYIAAEDPH